MEYVYREPFEYRPKRRVLAGISGITLPDISWVQPLSLPPPGPKRLIPQWMAGFQTYGALPGLLPLDAVPAPPTPPAVQIIVPHTLIYPAYMAPVVPEAFAPPGDWLFAEMLPPPRLLPRLHPAIAGTTYQGSPLDFEQPDPDPDSPVVLVYPRRFRTNVKSFSETSRSLMEISRIFRDVQQLGAIGLASSLNDGASSPEVIAAYNDLAERFNDLVQKLGELGFTQD